MRVVIYTVITGGHGRLYDVNDFADYEDVDFYCISDTDQPTGKGWKIIRVDTSDDPPRANRQYKTLPHLHFKEYDINVYVDSNKVVFDLPMLLNYCARLDGDDDTDAIFVRHHERDTVKQEVAEIIRTSKDKADVVTSQYEGYLQEGFPDNVLLAVCSVQIRKDNQRMRDFLEVWWHEIKTKSHRDQISWPYAVWKSDISYKMISVFEERLKMIGNADWMGSKVKW